MVHIYVDASFDRRKYSGLGSMVVDMAGKTLFFFSEAVDDDTLDNIMSKGQKTVIQELEMMAVLAVKSWRSFLKSRRVVLFTDSNSVRGSSSRRGQPMRTAMTRSEQSLRRSVKRGGLKF